MAAVAVASMEADTGEQTELSLLERRLAGGTASRFAFWLPAVETLHLGV